MGWLMFILGMMAGSVVGVTVMCIVFYAREPEIHDLTRNCTPNSP